MEDVQQHLGSMMKVDVLCEKVVADLAQLSDDCAQYVVAIRTVRNPGNYNVKVVESALGRLSAKKPTTLVAALRSTRVMLVTSHADQACKAMQERLAETALDDVVKGLVRAARS